MLKCPKRLVLRNFPEALVLMVLIGQMALIPPGSASQESASHVVTISVPTFLEISADQSTIRLTMNDFLAGSASDTSTVTYTIKSNNNRIAEGGAVLEGQLSDLFDSFNLTADVGQYTKTGGNASLQEAASGAITIKKKQTPLAVKKIDSGGGHVLRGRIPVTYQAVAVEDLSGGDESRALTITVSDT